MPVLLRILKWVRPYLLHEGLAYGTVLAINALRVYMPILVRRMVDEGIGGGDFRLLGWLAAATVGLTVARGFFMFGQGYLTEFISQHVAYDFRNAIYDKLQNLSFSYHDKSQTGQLLSRATSDVDRIRFFTGRGLLYLVDALLLFFSTSVIMMRMNVELSLVALALTPVIIVLGFKFGSTVRPLFREAQNKMGEVATRLQDNLMGLRIVKAFAQEDAEIKRFGATNDQVFDFNIRTARLRATYGPVMAVIVNLGTVLILWLGGNLVMANRLTLGELVAFNTYLLQLVGPMRRIGWIITSLSNAQAAGDRVFEILDAQSEVLESPTAVALPQAKGYVTFENVSFRYFGSSALVLNDISFEARPGQVVALLGATGSGKSTIINLIPRFYDVTEGRILIDGTDVRDVTLASLRRNIGIVLQESSLFASTIRENIAFGRPDTTEAEVIDAAKAAAAHEFIMSFPDGYDTLVGERGITLSGGQRQRVSIARAILTDPRILILDDSTSSVDAETEQIIQEALARLMEGRTSFVIAQRLSSVRNADAILLMDRGRLVAQGRHEDLLHESGLYAEIYYSQLESPISAADGVGEPLGLGGGGIALPVAQGRD